MIVLLVGWVPEIVPLVKKESETLLVGPPERLLVVGRPEIPVRVPLVETKSEIILVGTPALREYSCY